MEDQPRPDSRLRSPLGPLYSNLRTRAPYIRSHIGPAAISRENYAFFLQDTWKINPGLTLDYGVRWDLYTPISERARRTSDLTSAPLPLAARTMPSSFRTHGRSTQA